MMETATATAPPTTTTASRNPSSPSVTTATSPSLGPSLGSRRMSISNSSVSVVSTCTARTTKSISTSRTNTTISRLNSKSKDQVRSRLLNNLGIFNGAVDNAPNPAIARKIKIIRAMGLGGVIPPKPRSHHGHQHQQTKLDVNGQIVSVEVGADDGSVRPKINFSSITTEPLKYNEEEDDIVTMSSSSSSSSLSNFNSNSSSSSLNNNNINNNSGTTASTNGQDPNNNTDTNTNQQQSQNQSNNNNNKKPTRRKICFNDSVSVAHIPMRSEYSDRVRSRMWSNRYEIHENATRNAIEFQAEGWDWRSVVTDEGMFVCTFSGELIHPVHCQQ